MLFLVTAIFGLKKQKKAEPKVERIFSSGIHVCWDPFLRGLILRSAMQEKECPQIAKEGKAVLIAPPNQGSRFARALRQTLISPVLGKKAGYELMSKKNFSHLGEFPKSLDVLIIAGTFGFNPLIWEKNDGKVGVSETRLSTKHHHETGRTSHSVIFINY